MSEPRITALINTHNYGRFVGEAIESVLAQEMPAGEMEVLVVDDGSTDHTPEVVARFGERVRYVRKENGGQASALNRGFAVARGEIIATLDGDDLWLPGKVRRVLEEFARQPDAGMVYHPMEHWDVQRNAIEKDAHFPAVSGNVLEVRDGLLRYGDLSTSGLAFRKGAVEKLLPIPERFTILADAYLGGLIIFVAPIVALREHLTTYRVHGGNLCTFRASEPAYVERRLACSRAVPEEIKAWLKRRGYDLSQPDLAKYVKRHELVAQMVQFLSYGAERREYYSYLRECERLYAPLWPWRYRMFHAVAAVVALGLGYRRYEELRGAYSRSLPFMRLRKALFGGSPTPKHAGEEAQP